MVLIFGILIGLVVVTVLAAKIFVASQGDAKLIICTEKRTPLILDEMTDEQAVLTSRAEFRNDGSQAPTVIDCFARTLLPFEQYDGVDVRGKVECSEAPRDDDYFEACIIEPHDSIFINITLTITARKGMNIKEALSKMVDVPTDIYYSAITRRPYALFKKRVVFTAEEIAGAADVRLVED